MDNLDRQMREIIEGQVKAEPKPKPSCGPWADPTATCPNCSVHPVVKQLRGLADWLGRSPF